MIKEKAINIISDEMLNSFNWFNEHKIDPNEVGYYESDVSYVCSTDEKANLISKKEFQSESKALNNIIKRLRAVNKFNKL